MERAVIPTRAIRMSLVGHGWRVTLGDKGQLTLDDMEKEDAQAKEVFVRFAKETKKTILRKPG